MALIRFFHWTILGYTAVLPLLGALSVDSRPPLTVIAAILLVALAFHHFAYVLNDVIDLPIDRTQPNRTAYPLVQGRISVSLALWLALLHVPLAFAVLWWLGTSWPAAAALSGAFLGMAIYDVWGKRLGLPLLTDSIQGSAWGLLILTGALMMNTMPKSLTWLVIAFNLIYILIVNGVNGALRDVANDRHQGAVTTPLWFGVRPLSDESWFMPRSYQLYALVLQLLLFSLSLGMVRVNWQEYTLALRPWLLVGVGILSAVSWAETIQIIKGPHNSVRAFPWLMLHNVTMLALLFMINLPLAQRPFLLIFSMVFCLPLLTSDWLLCAGQTAFHRR